MRPMVAQVAAEDPDTAANSPLPKTLTCNNRPGMRRSQGSIPEKISSDRREWNRISPIQMNSGSGVSDQPDTELQAALPRMCMLDTPAKYCSPTYPRVSSETATQRPLPSST